MLLGLVKLRMVRRVENAARMRQDKSYDLVSSRRRWELTIHAVSFGCEQTGRGNWLNVVPKEGLRINIQCRLERIPFSFSFEMCNMECFQTMLLHICKLSVPDRQLL